MTISNKKIGILIENNYQELEFWYPYLRLQEENVKPVVIGSEVTSYHSENGYEAKSDISAKDAVEQTFDAIIIPGGYAPDLMRVNKNMVKIVRKTFDDGHLVAAICHAAWMLASADIVKNKNVTCFHSIKDDLIHAGANYHDDAVVVDGNLITSRVPSDLPDFCEKIISFLS